MVVESRRGSYHLTSLTRNFVVKKEFSLPNYQAELISGSELTREQRMELDLIINDVTLMIYPDLSSTERQVMLFYYRVDNFHPREGKYTDWWIISDFSDKPVAFASAYFGGVKRSNSHAFDGSPRLFYLGQPEAIIEHIEFSAKRAFKRGRDFPFVVDANGVDINNIELALERIEQSVDQNTYLYLAKRSRLPFVDETRVWLDRYKLIQPQLKPLPKGMSLRKASTVDFPALKKFLNRNHPLNSLAKDSLDEGIFYIITESGNGEKILASAGLSYPTLTPDGTHLICATDLATENDPKYMRHGLATQARVATFRDLFFGGEDGISWLQGDERWKDSLVVADNPRVTGEGARLLNLRLGYSPLMRDKNLYLRRWFTAGIKRKKALDLMAE